jgi:hypothetical protein
MAKVGPYHTSLPEHPPERALYHDHENCPDAKRIKPEHTKLGTAGRPRCKEPQNGHAPSAGLDQASTRPGYPAASSKLVPASAANDVMTASGVGALLAPQFIVSKSVAAKPSNPPILGQLNFWHQPVVIRYRR